MNNHNQLITQIKNEEEKFRVVTDHTANCANDPVTPYMKNSVKGGLNNILNQLEKYPTLKQQGNELIQAIDELTYENILGEIAPQYQGFMDTLLEALK